MLDRVTPERVLWDTSCLDWEKRLLSGRSLIPDLPLFEDQAAKALRIFKRLRVPDMIGNPTYGEVCRPWVLDLVRVVFGSYDEESKRRLLREFFVMVPKKNAKSSIAAAIIVTAAIMNVRPEAELLLIAPTKKIADIAYKQAAGIIRLDRELTKLFHPQTHQRTITHRISLAAIVIKAADTDVITGSKATFILVDETHVFAQVSKANEVFVEIRGSLAARPDGFLLQITTQSKRPPVGVFAQELATARDVRDGKIKLPLLPILYELPPRLAQNEGWKNPKYWPLINPNLGASVDENYLADELLKAERAGASALALLASQHFNVQIGVDYRVDGWAGALVWEAGVEPGLTLDQVLARSEVVVVGSDGGGLDDLLGVSVIGREKDSKRWLAWSCALVSTIGILRRKANLEHYLKFKRAGELLVYRFGAADQTPEAIDDRAMAELLDRPLVPDPDDPKHLPPDIRFVVELVKRVRDQGLLAQVGVDAAGIGALVDALADIDVTQDEDKIAAVRQGIGLMPALKTIERKLADGSFKHDGSALMRWCVGNLKVIPTRTAMMVARDEAGFGKIDPFMALANAAQLMSLNPSTAPSYQMLVLA